MQQFFIEVVEQWGYLGIALLIFVENVFPPIPSEVVLLFGGFLTTKTGLQPWGVVAAATVGSVLGAAVLYQVGRVLSKERLERILAGKWGKRLHLQPNHVEKADGWFQRWGGKAVLICRCIPVVRSLISIPAGISGMAPVPFYSLTVLGTTAWNILLVYAGAFAGDTWEKGLSVLGWYSKLVLAVLCVAGIAVVVAWRIHAKRDKAG